MGNLKLGRGNSINDIGFHMPLNILQKHSGRSFDLNNIVLNQRMNITTSEKNIPSFIIHLNKSDFINDMLKTDMVDSISQIHLKNCKPHIIEFR